MPTSSTQRTTKIDPPDSARIWVLPELGRIVRAYVRRQTNVLQDFSDIASILYARHFDDPGSDFFVYTTLEDPPMISQMRKDREGVLWIRGWSETSRAALLAAYALSRDT